MNASKQFTRDGADVRPGARLHHLGRNVDGRVDHTIGGGGRVLFIADDGHAAIVPTQDLCLIGNRQQLLARPHSVAPRGKPRGAAGVRRRRAAAMLGKRTKTRRPVAAVSSARRRLTVR